MYKADSESTKSPAVAATRATAVKWYFAALKKYAVFTGRARRKEYWYFTLFHLLIIFTLAFIAAVTEAYGPLAPGWVLFDLYLLGSLIPHLAVSARAAAAECNLAVGRIYSRWAAKDALGAPGTPTQLWAHALIAYQSSLGYYNSIQKQRPLRPFEEQAQASIAREIARCHTALR